jgi:hypothetical protein
MPEQAVIQAYLEGRLGPWAFHRKLVTLGVSVGTAFTLALGLPAVVRGEVTLEELASRASQTSRGDVAEIERLLAMVGHALLPAVQNGTLNPLAVSLAKLGVNVDLGVGEQVELNLEGHAGRLPINLAGNLMNLEAQDDFRNMTLVLGGRLGDVPINLAGSINAPLGESPGVNLNLGNADLNIVGNAGSVPLNFGGNIGNVLPD